MEREAKLLNGKGELINPPRIKGNTIPSSSREHRVLSSIIFPFPSLQKTAMRAKDLLGYSHKWSRWKYEAPEGYGFRGSPSALKKLGIILLLLPLCSRCDTN